MQILHGEHPTKSRDELATIINQWQSKGYEILRLEASKMSLADLEQALGSSSLFGTDRAVIIEHLHSLPRSKRKTELIKAVTSIDQQHPETPVILIEKRALTKTMLKQFPGAEITESKQSKALFKWVETFQPNMKQNPTALRQSLDLVRTATSQESAFFCLVIAARQIRLMIQVKETSTAAGPPFLIKKLAGQANRFSIDQLLAAHARLAAIDRRQKSTSRLNIEQELDLWLWSL